MTEIHHAFISYGRADSKGFVSHLHDRMLQQGFDVWLDLNDIPLGVDFQYEIAEGISRSENFLFLISPHSVNSPYCLREIEFAVRFNKRIIPLLHVEEISYDTWRSRHPHGTADEWHTYQTKGLHSSFPNMHPAISKINWIYFREGVDDFEKSFVGLIELFSRHQDYVRQHTLLLLRAQEWERSHRQSRYLLTGDERLKAAAWLTTRFQNEQLPCEPTDLHCEYICESTQNAENLMTRVFLTHVEKDRPIYDFIRKALMRQGFTVWRNQTDYSHDDESQEAVNRGIEAADNLLVLISQASLGSEVCQREIAYALSLNKRVIGLLADALPLEHMSSELRSLQLFDVSGSLDEMHARNALSRLITLLYEDAPYYEQHKVLLTRALKWQMQNKNPSILLRGHNLRQAEAWFKVAQGRSQHPPTTLQVDFIQTSLQQPPALSLDVFIAYSRVDSDFARKLNDALQIQGKTTWFDQESIASGTDYQDEIYQGIEACSNFVFIISPSSIQSPYCVGEVDYAQKLNKRIITILYRPVSAAELPIALASVQWIDFGRYQGDFYANFGELIRTLDTDLDYVRTHTRLLNRALEWQKSGHDPSYLLRGKSLRGAEHWLKQAVDKHPPPSELHREYINTSRFAPLPKPRFHTAGLTGLAIGGAIAGLRLLGLIQPVELAAYDLFLRLKPNEPMDERILVVEIDDVDIQLQNQLHPGGRGSLPEPPLTELLGRLQQHQPRVIGIDMYRDYPADDPTLVAHLRDDANLVVLCKLDYEETPGTLPPPELAESDYVARLGFSDYVNDRDLVVRRHLLINDPGFDCFTENAFSLVIARQYLEANGLPYGAPFTPEGRYIQPLQFDGRAIPRFKTHSGGYQNEDAGGYQALLNYRKVKGDVSKFVDRITLREALNGQLTAERVRDRIVLIGVTASQSVNDYFQVPQGGEIAGVLLQSQMVSQIISHYLDGRPLIWWWPAWIDAMWVVGWGVLGGVMVWWVQHPVKLTLLAGGTLLLLGCACFLVFIYPAGWLPLIPSTLAMLLSMAGIIFITLRFRK